MSSGDLVTKSLLLKPQGIKRPIRASSNPRTIAMKVSTAPRLPKQLEKQQQQHQLYQKQQSRQLSESAHTGKTPKTQSHQKHTSRNDTQQIKKTSSQSESFAQQFAKLFPNSLQMTDQNTSQDIIWRNREVVESHSCKQPQQDTLTIDLENQSSMLPRLCTGGSSWKNRRQLSTIDSISPLNKPSEILGFTRSSKKKEWDSTISQLFADSNQSTSPIPCKRCSSRSASQNAVATTPTIITEMITTTTSIKKQTWRDFYASPMSKKQLSQSPSSSSNKKQQSSHQKSTDKKRLLPQHISHHSLEDSSEQKPALHK